MKKLMLCLIIFSCCIALFSNPIMPRMISEIWMNEDGHMMAELCPYIISWYNPLDLQLSDGETSISFPEDFALPPDDEMCIVDFTEMFPELSFNPAEDSICVLLQFDEAYWLMMDWLVWGNDITHDYITPLQPGQSWVQNSEQTALGESIRWCKDAVPTPMQYPYASQSRAWVELTFINQDGLPIPGVYCYSGINGYTDSLGVAADSVFTGREYIDYIFPGTNNFIYAGSYWLEPDQVLPLTIQINYTGNEDHITPPSLKTSLLAYPSPANLNKDQVINIRYNGKEKLNRRSELKIYNIKGEYVTSLGMPSDGNLRWSPDQNISSGKYILRLISGNRIIGSTYLTIFR